MAQHEPVDPLVEFDALLKQELAATPSPEFLPRVRERIRLEPEPTRWLWTWILVPITAGATLALAAGLMFWPAATTSPVAPAAPLFTVAAIAPHANIPVYPPSRFALRRASRIPNPEPRVAKSAVVVDPRQHAALLVLMRMAGEGRLTEDAFKHTTPPPGEIGVQPMSVSPIPVGGVLQGESGRK